MSSVLMLIIFGVLGAGPHVIGNGDVAMGGSGGHLDGSVDSQSQGHVTDEGETTVDGTASGRFTNGLHLER